jgi:hypothetical protein
VEGRWHSGKQRLPGCKVKFLDCLTIKGCQISYWILYWYILNKECQNCRKHVMKCFVANQWYLGMQFYSCVILSL